MARCHRKVVRYDHAADGASDVVDWPVLAVLPEHGTEWDVRTACEPEQEIQRELTETETLLWTGRPRQGIAFHAYDIFAIPGSVFWTGGVFYMVTLWFLSDAPWPVFAVGLALVMPFILFGLFIVFGRFILEAKERERMCYGVTDQRIIFVYGLTDRKVRSLDWQTLTEAYMVARTDGKGTIAFSARGWHASLWGTSAMQDGPWRVAPWRRVPWAAQAFDTIPDVKAVHEMIEKARSAGRKQACLGEIRNTSDEPA